MSSQDIFKELLNKILLFLHKILLLFSVMAAIFKESLKIKVDMLMKTLDLNIKEGGKTNSLLNMESKKITKDFMMVSTLKVKNRERVNLSGMMDQLTKVSSKKVLSQVKVSFWIKNKITHMKVNLKMDKNMDKVLRKQESKIIRVFFFMIKGNSCLE